MVTSSSLGRGRTPASAFGGRSKEEQVTEAIFFSALLIFSDSPQQTCITYYFAIKGGGERAGLDTLTSPGMCPLPMTTMP